MMRILALIALSALCEGCFDFSLFDKLPRDSMVADLSTHDALDALDAVDFSGPTILLEDAFDEPSINWNLWGVVHSPSDAFSIDPSVQGGGRPGLKITAAQLSQGEGSLTWTGAFPNQPISLHARYWYRFHDTPDGNFDMLIMGSSDQGVSATVTANSELVLNNFGAKDTFKGSGAILKADTRQCIEVGIEVATDGGWNGRLWLNDKELTSAEINPLNLTTPVPNLGVGLQLEATQIGVTTAWVDNLVVVEGTSLIGCGN